MFTGIVTDLGKVAALAQDGDMRARIETRYDAEDFAIGASIACAGVCLTVVDKGRLEDCSWFDVQISAETLDKTTLGQWKIGDRINLERALKIGDELGGHIVSGHVDGRAKITEIEQIDDSTRVRFAAPGDLARFIAPKGSVALDGTSLTVNDVAGDCFDINFIPHTKAVTSWGGMQIGQEINLEIDTMARYVARLAEYS